MCLTLSNHILNLSHLISSVNSQIHKSKSKSKQSQSRSRSRSKAKKKRDMKTAPKHEALLLLFCPFNLLNYWSKSPGEPLHHFSPHQRQRPTINQIRTLGVRFTFPSSLRTTLSLFSNPPWPFSPSRIPTCVDRPWPIMQPISIFQSTPNF